MILTLSADGIAKKLSMGRKVMEKTNIPENLQYEVPEQSDTLHPVSEKLSLLIGNSAIHNNMIS